MRFKDNISPAFMSKLTKTLDFYIDEFKIKLDKEDKKAFKICVKQKTYSLITQYFDKKPDIITRRTNRKSLRERIK